MKMKRVMLIFMAIVFCLTITAQRQRVAVDIETLVPIGGVNVVAKGHTITTDSLGRFILPDSCRSMVLSHVNYESRLINVEEVGDTVFMISKLLNLEEVVVFGHGRHSDQLQELKKGLHMDKTEAQLAAIDPSSGADLLPLLTRLIPKKWRKNSKKARRERMKRILEEY